MRFRQSPETFTVEEIPLFEPSGRGDHLYVTFRRSGMSTPFILKQLQRALRVEEVEVGCAGNKDRDAVAVQTVSLPARVERHAAKALEAIGADVLDLRRHPHKLRTGKLSGNRFGVAVELTYPPELDLLREACERAEREGFPNSFGPQRFADGSGVEEGRRAFLGIRSHGPFRKTRFALSVFQSLMFNEVLELRLARGLYPAPVDGDLMKKHDTGGEFVAGRVDAALMDRVAAFEVSPTGPIFGGKMARPEEAAMELEKTVLASHGLTLGNAATARAPGTRRFLRVPTGRIGIQPREGGALLTFGLPPGSYASVLLAHLGVDIVAPERPR